MYSADAYGGLGMSTVGGPMASDNYKRAVHRPPPPKFTVEMLAPTKQGGGYAFGMSISPVFRGDRSSTGSRASNRSFNEPYEIWRRWEDCLWFQETIEVEYGRLARMKKQRLAKGKGVKKGGFYMQDQAASWESLPPGPDPNSVAQDVHNLIPRLTKKGTLFRVSQATIDHRQAELSAFIQALFRDDVPALLEELRSDRMVTDFFGYWRRDYDLEQKRQGRLKKYRNSMASSILSFYSGPDPDDSRSFTTTSSPTSESFPRSSMSSISSSESASPKKSRSRSRPLSGSSDSSSGSSPSSGGSIIGHSSSPSIAEEVPIVFGHNPRVQSLQSLPEDVDAVPLSPGAESFIVRRVKKRTSRETLYRRSARIFSTPPSLFLPQEDSVDESQEPPETPRNPRANRESWQTIGSVDTYLEGLGMTMPTSPTQIYHHSRLSIGSIATIMTTSSADAIIPRETMMHSTPGSNMLPKIGNRRSRPVSIMTASDMDGSWSDGDEEILDSGLFDAFPMPAHLFPHRFDVDSFSDNHATNSREDQSPSRPETPSARRTSCTTINGLDDIEERPETPSAVVDEAIESPSTPRMSIPPIQLHVTPAPPSPARSDFSTATTSTNVSISSNLSTSTMATAVTAVSDTSTLSPASGGTWTVKAAHNHSIILVRVPKTTTFEDLRNRIHAKFVHQEGVSLSETFTLAFVIPDVVKNRKTGKSRERSNSVGTAGGVQMALVASQEQWDRVTESSGDLGKITLRVLDGM